ncbi:MAG: YifB family Mg chelatase-like AAA ATPase [Pseudomonadota bacterium]
MTLAVLRSRAHAGIQAPQVTVEVHLGPGLPGFAIVGLPEKAVQESRDRVRGALQNAGFEFPARRIIVNLAPADLPKEGGRFDLAIALGILAASGQMVARSLDTLEFLGELALSGEIRPVVGALPAAMATRGARRALILPAGNAPEASHISELRVLPAGHLLEVTAHLNGHQPLTPFRAVSASDCAGEPHPDLAEVRGQAQAKRALQAAAAGGHSLLMSGPPGTGKTLLARRLPGLLPPLSEAEALEVAAVRSVAGHAFDTQTWRRRPFRTPHHTASAAALVGGGSTPRPGEISLAHLGILFLDELPEFDRRVLEVLREPLESGNVTVSRAARQAEFPARFQLVAAMNPCPCGHLGDTRQACRCSPEQIRRYRARISGPLLDRIDLHLEVPPLPPEVLDPEHRETPVRSADAQARVVAARERQLQRQGKLNTALNPGEIDDVCALEPAQRRLLEQAMERLRLSARAYHRVLRLARTLADMAAEARIGTVHLTEAIGYRALDRQG